MRTRSCSESTTMSTGILSPKSCSQKTHVLDNPDWAYFEETGHPSQKTISTPFPHKYKTELCKNWENIGSCIYGDTVRLNSYALVFVRSWSRSAANQD